MAVDAYEALICQLLTDKNLLVQLACYRLVRRQDVTQREHSRCVTLA